MPHNKQWHNCLCKQTTVILILAPQERQVTQLVRIHSHLLLLFQLYVLDHLASPNSELTSDLTTEISSEIL